MKTYSQTQPDTYVISGNEVRIHWDVQEQTTQDMDGQDQTQWVANEAVAFVHDTREILIEKIIGSVYSVQQEIATINNRDEKPDTYDDYQSLRATAKQLADNWLSQKAALLEG